MKRKHLIGGLLLSAFMSLGAVVAFNNAKEDTKVEAAAGDKVIYFDFSLNSKFQEAGCNPYVRYWNGSQNYVALNHVANNIYATASAIPSAVLTNGSYGLEAYCWNQADKGNDCTTQWIFGGGYFQYANYNYVCVDEFHSGYQNGYKGYGYYSTTHEISNPGASAATQRIFVNNENDHGFYSNDDWGTPCKNVIGYFHNSNWQVIEMPAIQNSVNGKYYYYADIPSSVTDFHVFRMSRSTGHKYLAYLDAYCETISYGKCHYIGTYSYDDAKNINPDIVGGADDTVLVKVVEAYLTCSNSVSNGSNPATVANLKSTWFDSKDSGAKLTRTFNDYANGNTSYTGNKTRTTTIAEKWEAMQSKAASYSSGSVIINLAENKGNSIAIVAVVALVSIAGVGGYFFLRKKKEN